MQRPFKSVNSDFVPCIGYVSIAGSSRKTIIHIISYVFERILRQIANMTVEIGENKEERARVWIRTRICWSAVACLSATLVQREDSSRKVVLARSDLPLINAIHINNQVRRGTPCLFVGGYQDVPISVICQQNAKMKVFKRREIIVKIAGLLLVFHNYNYYRRPDKESVFSLFDRQLSLSNPPGLLRNFPPGYYWGIRYTNTRSWLLLT